jgi:hypothetical protein
MSAVDSQIEQALAVLQNRTAAAATLRIAADQARLAIRAIDQENELAPQREAEILAGMASAGIQPTLEALGALDQEGERRAHLRKAATHLAATLDALAIEMAAAERARDPAVVREGHLQALFAKIPSLLKTDVVISKLARSAYSRVPRPQGGHVGYIQTFNAPRVLATPDVLKSTKLPGFWPPKWSDYSLLERSDYEFEEAEAITDPLRELCQKSSVSEDEVQIAIDRAQHVLLNEFARVCAEIHGHYPGGLPRSIGLPAIGAHAMAAE